MNLSPHKSFVLAISLGAFALIGGTGLTVSSAWLITMASQHPPVLVLGVAIVMVRFFGIFRSVARYGERVISHESIFKKLTQVRVELFNAIASRINSNARSVAQESKAVIDDVERAQEFHLRVTLPGLYATFATCVTLFIALWIGDFLLHWVAALSLFLAIAIPLLVRRMLDPIAVEIEDNEGVFAEEVAAASHAMIEAEIFGYRSTFEERMKTSIRNILEIERKNFSRLSLLQLSSIIAIGSTLVGVSLALHRGPDRPAIQISMAIFLILVGFEGFTSWFPNLFVAGKNRRAAQNVERLSREKSPVAKNGQVPLNFDIHIQGAIPFWSEKFLKPITCTIAHGETILITGASGVGKSTLASGLLGFAQYSGSISVGGVELSEIVDRSKVFAGTLQESHIFNTSLRENLRIARTDVDDGDLLTVLRAVELDSIGLDEILGEFGRHLSGGEAKRLAVARALLSQAPVLILDEPLEHLDYELSIRIQARIREHAGDKTLIVITHSPWLQYDRKLILERE
jgi:ABC-type transport system involved in cytochrome bd biosynthesis fused ATPase/permease subunit